VEALIGPDSVNTMPPATLDAFRDHGVAVSAIETCLGEARLAMAELLHAGIDLQSITQELEKAGVELFCDAYRKIIKGIGAKR
jgi:transaldolase/glucose-6-phosphate isomerase